MALAKVTFTLDPATVGRIEEASALLAMPKSQVVREAVLEFSERIGKLGESEKLRMLRAFDEVVPRIPLRNARHVDAELLELRRARRAGGRASRRIRRP